MENNQTNWCQSVTGVVIRDGKVLLARHTYGSGKGLLIVPGGFVQVGESPQEALKREFLEETKVIVEPRRVIAIRFNLHDWYVAFSADYVSGEAASDHDENDEVVWLGIDEALRREDVPDLTKKLITCAMQAEKGFLPLPYVGNPKNGPGFLYGIQSDPAGKMNRDNIILIGMSGAGKSTLGVLLAKALGKNFFDTDILIQQTEGRLLQQIIDTDGTDYFLQVEERVVNDLNLHGCVIATGGSVVYSERAMRHLKENGTAVYLAVDYEELVGRLSNITTRGIVFKGSGDLRSVYEERLPLYEQYGDIRVECTGRDVESSVREIVAALQNA